MMIYFPQFQLRSEREDRKMEWWLQRRYLMLLLALASSMVVYPLLRDTLDAPLVSDMVLSVVFVAAFRVIFTKARWQIVALLLGVPPLIGIWTGYVLPGLPRPPLAIGFHVWARRSLATPWRRF